MQRKETEYYKTEPAYFKSTRIKCIHLKMLYTSKQERCVESWDQGSYGCNSLLSKTSSINFHTEILVRLDIEILIWALVKTKYVYCLRDYMFWFGVFLVLNIR